MYSNLFRFAQQMPARSQVSLWHRLGADTMCWPSAHAWPVTSPPRACDAYLAAVFWQDAFSNVAWVLFWVLFCFFFEPWEKMFLHFTGCFDVLKGVCGGERLTELCRYKRVICFRPLCREKRHRGWGIRTAKRVPAFTQTHSNRAQPQPQACKHSHFDLSRLALVNPYFFLQIYSYVFIALER